MTDKVIVHGPKTNEDFPSGLDNFIAWISAIRDCIPAEHRNSARVEIVGAGFDADIQISYRGGGHTFAPTAVMKA